jgi:hypothetical protein
MEAAIKAPQAKASAKLAANTRDCTESERFLKAAAGLTRMLRTPAINVLLADVDEHPHTTVGDLLGFMKAFNLRFGVADDLREWKVYDQLYPLLAKLSDEPRPERKAGPPAKAEANSEHPIEFFSSMEDQAISPAGETDSGSSLNPARCGRDGRRPVPGHGDRLAGGFTDSPPERHDDLEDEPVVGQAARDDEQVEQVVGAEDARPEGGTLE